MEPATIPLFNREYSWIEFNRRVLGEAQDETVPLLERLKFLAITASNLDEFLMVRAGNIRDMVTAEIAELSADGLTPVEQLRGIHLRVHALLEAMYRTLYESLLPELRKAGIKIDEYADLPKKDQAAATEHYRKNIAPILTPLAIDPGHPFPFLPNLAVNLGIVLESSRGEEHIAFLRVPSLVPRLVRCGESSRYVPVESLIAQHVGEFFPGLQLRSVVPFRVIRNSDLAIREDEVHQDLLQSIEAELRRRDRKEVVSVELAENPAQSLVELLVAHTHVSDNEIFHAPGLIRLSDLMQIYSDVKKPSLKDAPFNPRIASQLATSEDIFSIIRRGDVLLHRPFDSFGSVVEFVQAAAEDPDVLAIKQTLYRTDRGSPIVEALAAAGHRGKQVIALVELQARFDEKKNIEWARQLEEAGVQVVYGLVGIKTHCKVCLVVRREGDTLRRYVHLSTGNYNATTGRLYTDVDLFTCDVEVGEDASQVMNLLTGFSITSVQDIFESGSAELKWRRAIVAPLDYQAWTVAMIQREIRHAREGRPAQIIAKMNSLVDPAVIEALYLASQNGVRIDLIVRGICCLVPGLPKISENIRVLSVIDRFLEHSRIFLFRNGGDAEVFLSSGDWMPRNFIRRVELTVPVLSPSLEERLENEILATYLADNVKAWKLQPDGSYRKRTPGANAPIRSQERFIEIARSEAVRLGPYEEIISKPGKARRKAKKNKKRDKGRRGADDGR